MSSVKDKIPEGWVETTLVELTKKIGSGATPRGGSDSYKEQGISLIRSQNILDFDFSYNGLAFIDETQARKLSNVTLEQKDVLINITGDSVARVCMVPSRVLPARVNQHVAIIRANTQKIDNHFLLYYLLDPNFKRFLLQIASNGATRNALTKSDLESLLIKTPIDLKEQKAIAQVLTAFDDKIENLKAQNQTLETLAQTIFKEWFGKYQIGDDLPEGWRVGKITELFEVRDGTHDSPKEQSVGFKLITSKHLDNNRLLIEDAYFISENDYNQVNKRSKVEKYDILFSMIGTIGLAYFELNDKIDYAIKNVALFKCSQNKQWANYTYLWLTSFLGKHFIATNKSGSTQEYVSLTSLRNIDFIIPVERKLIDFNKIMNPIFEKILSNSKQLQTLTQTRDTLLPKLMSGQLRVKEFNKYTRIKNYGRTI